jgi:hypothetical protein
MRPSFEDLIGRGGRRERVEVYERQPPAELVAAKDILRRDQLGRTVVVVPKGCVPPSWLQLTEAEQSSLVDPPPPVPAGTMRRRGPFGFYVEGVAVSPGFVD